MNSILLNIKNIQKKYGEKLVLKGINLAMYKGEILSLFRR